MATSLSDHYHISTASQLQCLALVPLRPLKTVHWLFINRLLCRHQLLFPPVKNNKRSSMRESGTSLVLLAHHCHTACYWRLRFCFTIPPLTLWLYITLYTYISQKLSLKANNEKNIMVWSEHGRYFGKSSMSEMDGFLYIRSFSLLSILLLSWSIQVKLISAGILSIVSCSMFFFFPISLFSPSLSHPFLGLVLTGFCLLCTYFRFSSKNSFVQ